MQDHHNNNLETTDGSVIELQKRKEKAFVEENKEQVAQSCNSLGDFYNQQGRYKDALKEYEQEAKIYSRLGLQYKLEMAKAHRMIGEMFMLLSEFESALKNINIYLKTVKELKNKVEEQRAYATIGRAYLLHGQSQVDTATSQNQLKSAEKSFIKSLLISKELNGQISKIEQLDMQARLYLNIGVVKEHMEDFEESLSYMEKAIKISKANDIYELLHLCYISASLLYEYKKNDATLALRFCNLALEVAERLPEKVKKVCETLITKAEIMIKVGDFQSAKQVLQKAYKMQTPDYNDRQNIEKSLKVVYALCKTLDSLILINSTDYASRKTLYEKMGDGCCLLQNYSKAIEYYLKMLECAELNDESTQELIPIYVSLYQTYKDNNDNDKALEYLWKEFELNKNRPEEALNTLCNIGEICELQLKPFWTVYEIYQKALLEAQKMNSIKMEKIVFVRQYKCAIKSNMNSIAEDIKEQAESKNINLDSIDEESEPEELCLDENTPDVGEDICLDDLTDSNSESEGVEKSRATRKRGNVSLTIKRNNKGETQLHQACISGNLELARRLIDQGHSVNVRDHAGWLPLHEACNHGYRDIVELLLDRGATSAINDKGGTSCDGITPLYDACSNGFLDVIELLLERGANATLKTDFGDNCLNILDKWKNSEKLDACQQYQYERIRSKLAFQLNKIGEHSSTTSLNNSNSRNTSLDNSLDKLKRLAYNSDSEVSNEEAISDREINESLHNNINRQSYDRTSEFNDDNEISRSILRESNTKHNSKNKKISAKNEYKNVMKTLKHPNRVQTLFAEETLDANITKKRNAFLDPEEVGDDWLDDDLGPDKKKRKYITDDKIYATDPASKKQSEKIRARSPNSCLSLTAPRNAYDLDFNSNDSFDTLNQPADAFELLLTSNNRQTGRSKSKMPRTLSMNSASNKKSDKSNYQSSLLENGFCRFKDSFQVSNESLSTIEPDSTTVFGSPTKNGSVQTKKTSLSIVNQVISFKIKIEDEMLLVPVDKKKVNEVNIKWLAEEASRRYYNLVGLKPVLRLMTADGFAFEETDAISAALEENMISSKVLEWKIAPISQRYEEMCHQLNQEIDQSVRQILEKGQVSNYISFNDYSLTFSLTEPIFKALLHQSQLRSLDLSNNFIQNEGCKQLGKSLPTLKQLKFLNLQGNCITFEGLEYLIQGSGFTELETINLSFNPLGNKSIRNLEKICQMSEKLCKLYLQSSSISNFYDFDLNFHQLMEFDISFNSIHSDALKYLLPKLSSCRMQYLNMNFVVDNTFSAFGTIFYDFLEKGNCEKLKQIEIAGCNLNDSDIYKIVKYLAIAKNLEVINLSENCKLSSASFQYIFENLSFVRKIMLNQCPRIIETSRLEKLHLNSLSDKYPEFISLNLNNDEVSDNECYSEMETALKKFWFHCHGEKGKFLSIENYKCLYVNESDIK